MKLWVRKLFLIPLYPILTLIMLIGLVMIVKGETAKRNLDRTLEKPVMKCKTIYVGKYVVCKNCDFKEFA